MNARDHVRMVRRLAERDGRYRPEAFLFVSEAVAHTQGWVRKGEIPRTENDDARGGEGEFHVSGQELLRGILRLSRERWGELAPVVLGQWGVYRTEDFGEIVFLMVEDEEMQWKKRECDRREDFAEGFDFKSAFRENG